MDGEWKRVEDWEIVEDDVVFLDSDRKEVGRKDIHQIISDFVEEQRISDDMEESTDDLPDHTDDKVKKLYQLLTQVARDKKWITYGQVADMLDINISNADERWRVLGKLMDKVNDIDVEKDRPLLTSLIVTETPEGMMAGEGFFTYARQKGLLSNENKRVFWAEQLKRSHEYWG